MATPKRDPKTGRFKPKAKKAKGSRSTSSSTRRRSSSTRSRTTSSSARSRTAPGKKGSNVRGKLIDVGLPSDLADAFNITEMRGMVGHMRSAERRYKKAGEARGASVLACRRRRFEDAIRLRQRRSKNNR